jgi:hypothetical protein
VQQFSLNCVHAVFFYLQFDFELIEVEGRANVGFEDRLQEISSKKFPKQNKVLQDFACLRDLQP